MAVAFDTQSSGSTGAINATSKTVAHTIATGNARLLLVGVSSDGTITGVTYAGTAMTQVGTASSIGGGNLTVWALQMPTSGANNIIATASASSAILISAVSLTGANSSVAPANNKNTAAAATSVSTSLTPNSANNMFVEFAAPMANRAPSGVGAGQTQAATTTASGGLSGAGMGLGASYELIAASTSQSLSENTGIFTEDWAQFMVSVEPAVYYRITSQDATATGAASATATYPGATTAGNLLIADCFTNALANTLAISGWTVAGSTANDGLSPALRGWQFWKVATGSETTVAVTGGNTATRIVLSEYVGLASPTVDGSAITDRDTATHTTFTTSSITTAGANELVHGAFHQGANVSAVKPSAPFAYVKDDAVIRTYTLEAFLPTASTKTAATTWTTSSQARTILVAYQAGGGAADLSVNISDSITITASIGATLVDNINASDTVTTTESINRTLVDNAALSDTVTTTENVKLLLENNVTVSDSVSVTDTPVILIPFLLVNVTDNITVSESVKSELNSFVNKSDSITITENRVVVDELNISVNDSVTATENIQRLLESNLNVSDTVTTTESVTAFIPTLVINTNDSITISESVKSELNSFINKSDTVTTTESVTPLLQSFVSKSDSITLTENVKAELNSFVNVNNTITITENASVSIATTADLNLTVSDTITTTESVNELLQSFVSVSDNLTITESIGTLLTSFINKSESVTITENTVATIPYLFVTTSDSITITEDAEAANPAGVHSYRLLPQRHASLGPRGSIGSRPVRGPRGTRSPRSY